MLGGWKVEGVSELSDLILQSAAGAGIVSDRLRGRSVELEVQVQVQVGVQADVPVSYTHLTLPTKRIV